MGKSERAMSLTRRRQAITVIRNIQSVRSYLLKNKFDERNFDRLNGKDAAIEQLLDRKIIFSMMDESERDNLRLEIKTKLTATENEAIGALRASTSEYFSQIKSIVENPRDVGTTNKVISDLSSKNEYAIKAFENFVAEKGVLDCERVMATLEHVDSLAEKIEESIPSILSKLEAEETEYEEEKHEHEDDLPQEDDSNDNADDGSKETELPEEEEASKADGDENSEIADFTFVKGMYAFMEACNKFETVENKSLGELGFGSEQAVEILNAKKEIDAHYKSALEKFMNILNGETATVESLLFGKTKFFQQLDRVTTLVEKMEKYRDLVDASCKCLVAASDEMLKETIKKRW